MYNVTNHENNMKTNVNYYQCFLKNNNTFQPYRSFYFFNNNYPRLNDNITRNATSHYGSLVIFVAEENQNLLKIYPNYDDSVEATVCGQNCDCIDGYNGDLNPKKNLGERETNQAEISTAMKGQRTLLCVSIENLPNRRLNALKLRSQRTSLQLQIMLYIMMIWAISLILCFYFDNSESEWYHQHQSQQEENLISRSKNYPHGMKKPVTLFTQLISQTIYQIIIVYMPYYNVDNNNYSNNNRNNYDNNRNNYENDSNHLYPDDNWNNNHIDELSNDVTYKGNNNWNANDGSSSNKRSKNDEPIYNDNQQGRNEKQTVDYGASNHIPVRNDSTENNTHINSNNNDIPNGADGVYSVNGLDYNSNQGEQWNQKSYPASTNLDELNYDIDRNQNHNMNQDNSDLNDYTPASANVVNDRVYYGGDRNDIVNPMQNRNDYPRDFNIKNQGIASYNSQLDTSTGNNGSPGYDNPYDNHVASQNNYVLDDNRNSNGNNNFRNDDDNIHIQNKNRDNLETYLRSVLHQLRLGDVVNQASSYYDDDSTEPRQRRRYGYDTDDRIRSTVNWNQKSASATRSIPYDRGSDNGSSNVYDNENSAVSDVGRSYHNADSNLRNNDDNVSDKNGSDWGKSDTMHLGTRNSN